MWPLSQKIKLYPVACFGQENKENCPKTKDDSVKYDDIHCIVKLLPNLSEGCILECEHETIVGGNLRETKPYEVLGLRTNTHPGRAIGTDFILLSEQP